MFLQIPQDMFTPQGYTQASEFTQFLGYACDSTPKRFTISVKPPKQECSGNKQVQPALSSYLMQYFNKQNQLPG